MADDRVTVKGYVPANQRDQPELRHFERQEIRASLVRPEPPDLPAAIATGPLMPDGVGTGVPSGPSLPGPVGTYSPLPPPQVPQFVDRGVGMPSLPPGLDGYAQSAQPPEAPEVPSFGLSRSGPTEMPELTPAEKELLIFPDKLTRRDDISRHEVYWAHE